MNRLVSSISILVARKDSRRIIISSAVLFLALLLILQNENSIMSPEAVIVSILGSLLAAFNLSLAYVCMHAYRNNMLTDIDKDHPLYAYLRAGFATYGTAFMSMLLAFLGFSSMLSAFPKESRDVGYIGLIILLIASYALARKAARSTL